MKNVYEEYIKMATRTPPSGEPSETYYYEQENGVRAYVVKKWGSGPDKAFSIQHFVGYGNAERGEDGWEAGYGDTGPILYKLPQLLGSLEPVHIPEGEKDVDTLTGLGLVATTNPNGALSWTDEYSKVLSGRSVVLYEDHDAVGQRRTDLLAKSLSPYVASISIVRFADLPPKSDVSDFLKSGKTLDDLKARTKLLGKDFFRDLKGRPAATRKNVVQALSRLGVKVSHNEFQDRTQIEGLAGFGPPLDDAAMIRLHLTIAERFGLHVGKETFCDMIADEARNRRFHPVRNYLDDLKWDGVPRLSKWLESYAGAEATPYTEAVGAIVLIAAVRRIRQPGCKFDEMLVLESAQGKDKSTALAILAKREEWFSDDLPLNMDTQKIIERMAGRWIIEAAELKGMRKGDVEHLKSFLSRRVDRARMAYGRLPVEVPRQSIVIGTDNSGQYLRDPTGNRRIWPVRITQFDLAALSSDVDQLWAEAAHREAAGESIRLDPELWAAAADEQDERRIDDPFVELLGYKLGDREGKVRATDLWEVLDIGVAQRTQEQSARLGSAMKQMGFERTKLRFGNGHSEWAYRRGVSDERIELAF